MFIVCSIFFPPWLIESTFCNEPQCSKKKRKRAFRNAMGRYLRVNTEWKARSVRTFILVNPTIEEDNPLSSLAVMSVEGVREVQYRRCPLEGDMTLK